METIGATANYGFEYPLGTDSLSNLAERIQKLAEQLDSSFNTLGVNLSSTAKLMQEGDAAGNALSGTYPNPTLATNAVTTTKILDGTITNAKLADNTLTADKIAPNAITSSELADNSVDTAALQNESVTNAKIGSLAVTSDKLASNIALTGVPTAPTANALDNSTTIATTEFVNDVTAGIIAGQLSADSITTAMLQTGSVTNTKIASGAVTTEKIVTDAVTTDKIAPLDYLDFNTLSVDTLQEGRLVWNDTEGVLTMGIKGNPVPLYLGEQVMDRVTNVQGASIPALSAVRAFGASGNRLTVKLARADSETTSTNTFGITTASIADNQSGYTISQGLIKDVDTSGLTEGAQVWLSPSVAGGLTTTKPTAPDNLVLIGFCVRSHAVNGILLVKIVNGFELDELHDVQITSVANNDLLQYSTTNNTWKNVASVAANKITGTAVTQADTGTVTSTMIADNTIVSGDISTAYPGHLVVANTAARPASPTIGQIIYQSDTGEFLKWVTDIDSTNRWMQIHTAYTPNRNMLLNSSMNVNQRTLGPVQITNKALTTNVVTLTTSTPHGFRSGCTLVVSIGDPVFDGVVTVTSTPSTTTFTYARTAANVTAVATSGWATVAVSGITATATGGAAPYITVAGYSTTDRWKKTLVTHGTYIQSVVRDAPANTMLRNSLKAFVSTINTTLSGAQEARFSQTIEGQEAQVIRKGTANALPTVLSFWVKSNVPGTYIVELTDSANTRQISKSYTINVAGTWEKKVITIPADTTGVLFNDNTAGLELSWWLGAGSTYTSGTLNSTNWAATTNANRAVGQTNLAGSATSVATTAAAGTGTIATLTVASHSFVAGDHITVAGVTPAGYNGTYVVSSVTPTTISYYNTTTGAQTVAGTVTGSYWQLTGVQFEVGTAPSELEIVRFEDDLLRCQRYYYRLLTYLTTASTIAMGLSISATGNIATYTYPVNMRVTPTTVETSGTAADYGTTNGSGGQIANSAVPSFTNGTNKTAVLTTTVAAGLTAGQGGSTYFSGVIGAYLGFNADF